LTPKEASMLLKLKTLLYVMTRLKWYLLPSQILEASWPMHYTREITTMMVLDQR